jgi:hypothetical protein
MELYMKECWALEAVLVQNAQSKGKLGNVAGMPTTHVALLLVPFTSPTAEVQKAPPDQMLTRRDIKWLLATIEYVPQL